MRNEPLTTVILMRVTNTKAPHYGEVGRVIDVPRDDDDMTWLTLRFKDGDEHRYDRTEVELWMP
jgi:hypothetical protein